MKLMTLFTAIPLHVVCFTSNFVITKHEIKICGKPYIYNDQTKH